MRPTAGSLLQARELQASLVRHPGPGGAARSRRARRRNFATKRSGSDPASGLARIALAATERLPGGHLDERPVSDHVQGGRVSLGHARTASYHSLHEQLEHVHQHGIERRLLQSALADPLPVLVGDRSRLPTRIRAVATGKGRRQVLRSQRAGPHGREAGPAVHRTHVSRPTADEARREAGLPEAIHQHRVSQVFSQVRSELRPGAQLARGLRRHVQAQLAAPGTRSPARVRRISGPSANAGRPRPVRGPRQHYAWIRLIQSVRGRHGLALQHGHGRKHARDLERDLQSVPGRRRQRAVRDLRRRNKGALFRHGGCRARDRETPALRRRRPPPGQAVLCSSARVRHALPLVSADVEEGRRRRRARQ